MRNTPPIPTHTFETEQPEQATQTMFMMVDWGGPRKVIHTPHRHAFYELIFILNGGGRHEIDFYDYPLQTFSVHFVKSAQVHLIDRTDHAQGCSLLFSEDFLHTIRQNADLQQIPFFQIPAQPLVQLNEEAFEQIRPILANIKTETTNSKTRSSIELIRAYCQVLLLIIGRAYHALPQPPVQKPQDNIVQQFFQLIDLHFAEHLNLEQYAVQLQLSANYLSELCKRQTGKTAHQLMQERVLLEAKRLLCYSELSIKAIAYKLNFTDTSYFSRFFKKHTHVSPAEYRQSSVIR